MKAAAGATPPAEGGKFSSRSPRDGCRRIFDFTAAGRAPFFARAFVFSSVGTLPVRRSPRIMYV